MDLMDLPNEILLKILSFLRLKEVNNLKIVSKKFYNGIADIYFKLDPLSIFYLNISSYQDPSGEEKYDIRLFFEYTKNMPFRDGKFEKKNLTIDEVKIYFKWLEFKNLFDLTINASNVTGIFKLLNNYIKYHRLRLNLLHINIKKCPLIESFLEFLSYIDNTYHYELQSLCFYPMKLTEELNFNSFKSLESLTVRECQLNNLIKQEHIPVFFIGNPRLKYVSLKTQYDKIDDNSVNKIFDSLFDICKNNCSRHRLGLYLQTNEANDFTNKLSNYIKNNHYVLEGSLCYDKNVGYQLSIRNESDCSACGKPRLIKFQCVKKPDSANDCC